MKDRNMKGVEDPVEALFSLAREAEETYSSIKNIVYYAYFFIFSSMIFLIILTIAILSEGNIALAVFLVAVLISGAVLLRLVVFTRNFVEYFVSRFRKIDRVRNMDILIRLPQGRDDEERVLNYIQREVSSAYRPVRPFNHGGVSMPAALVRSGLKKGAIPLLRVKKPTLKEIVTVEREIERVVTAGLPVDRVALLYSPGGDYDGLPDDVYTYLAEGKFSVNVKGKRVPIPVQMFVLTEEGCEIIPPLLL